MSDTKTPGEKKLSVSKLTLKPRAETGVVRQSFSHGRSKAVVVEKVKRRVGGPLEAKAPEPAPAAPAAPDRSATVRRGGIAPRGAPAPAAPPPAIVAAPAAVAPKASGV